MDPYRKLLVLATNKLLEQGLISLERSGSDRPEHRDPAHLITEVAGQPTVIAWAEIGFEELRISVWWKYDHSLHPQASLGGNLPERFLTSAPLSNRRHYPKFVGVTVSGWLERKTGRYLQGHGREGLFDLYARKEEVAALQALATPTPAGFAAEGKRHL